jgi:hypothetical protein
VSPGAMACRTEFPHLPASWDQELWLDSEPQAPALSRVGSLTRTLDIVRLLSEAPIREQRSLVPKHQRGKVFLAYVMEGFSIPSTLALLPRVPV